MYIYLRPFTFLITVLPTIHWPKTRGINSILNTPLTIEPTLRTKLLNLYFKYFSLLYFDTTFTSSFYYYEKTSPLLIFASPSLLLAWFLKSNSLFTGLYSVFLLSKHSVTLFVVVKSVNIFVTLNSRSLAVPHICFQKGEERVTFSISVQAKRYSCCKLL